MLARCPILLRFFPCRREFFLKKPLRKLNVNTPWYNPAGRDGEQVSDDIGKRLQAARGRLKACFCPPLCSPNKASGTTEHWQDEPCRCVFQTASEGFGKDFGWCADTDKKGRLKPCFAAFRRLQTGWQSESAVCVFAAFKKPPDCRHSRAGGNLGAGQSGILLSERLRTPKRFPSARE